MAGRNLFAVEGRNLFAEEQEVAPEQNIAPIPEPSIVDRTADLIKIRQARVAEGFKKVAEGEQSIPESAGDIVGQSAGAIWDAMGEAIVTGAKQTFNAAPEEAQNFLKVGFESLMNAVPSGVKNNLAAGVDEGFGVYEDLEKSHPRLMRQVGNLGNVLLMASPAKTGNVSAAPTITRNAELRARKATLNAALTQREKLVSMIRPEAFKNTEAGKLESLRTKVIGTLGTKKITPSKVEEGIARELARVPGLSPLKSFTNNQNKVTEEISKIATSLNKQLETIAVTAPKFKPGFPGLTKKTVVPKSLDIAADTNFAIKDVVDSMKSRNLLLTENVGAAQDLANNAIRIVSNAENTPLGMLKARQALDDLTKSWGKQFQDKKSVFDIANREIRQVINKTVAKNAQSVKVEKLLEKESKLFAARDVLSQKAFNEGSNVILRHMTNLTDLFGARGKILTGVSIALGTTVLGASQVAAAPIGVALGSYIAGKGIKQAWGTPAFQKGLAKMIKATDKALKVAKDPKMVKSLKTDRAAILEIMQNMEVKEPEETPIPESLIEQPQVQPEPEPQDTQISIPLTDSEGNRGTASLSGTKMLSDIDSRQKALEDLLKAMG